jgi:ABC-type polysaccharide/polyol phosphate transport system ATPase subunit
LPEGAVRAAHVWKRFRTARRRMLFRDELERLIGRMRGRSVPGWRWALRDVDFEVDPGEAVGLVGVNGSGKTTLLRLIASVMYPYAGRISTTGRIGALIEVRSGIHPDLTGRENVFLYGSLLGLRRHEVVRRFDDIVGFAELEAAIDRQVKYYSSGMQMRLGFAVAAFLEPDILLVDEVLAVGDAAFQQKCLDRMRALLGQGTTLIFVSHDLAAVEATCSRLLWLREGEVTADGPSRDVLGSYRASIEAAAKATIVASGDVRLVQADLDGSPNRVRTDGPLDVCLLLETSVPVSGSLFIGVSEGPATPIFLLRKDVRLRPGTTEARCRILRLPVPRGRFYVWMGLIDVDRRDVLPWHPVGYFDVQGPDLEASPRGVIRLAPIHVPAEWVVMDISSSD